jgi:Aerotolerance regulator N-terminal/von Willebrand factor type A domain
MSTLGFLSPLFLLGALAVAVPLVLHLLRQRVDPVFEFSAVRFLRRAPVERARRRRLRDVLLFLLRSMALLLLAFGFARPYFQTGAPPPEPPVTVVLADVSASMGGQARTARLRELARAAVEAAPSGHAVGLVRFAATADVLVAPTLDRGAVKAAAAQLEAGFGPTMYRVGFARAAEALGTKKGRVTIVTDLQSGGWTAGAGGGVPSGTEVTVSDVGPLPRNMGIVLLSTTPDGLLARLRNTGGPRDAAVSVEVNGVRRDGRTVPLAGNGSVDVSLRVPIARGDTVAARLVDPGGLPGDDVVWLVRSEPRRERVVVVVSPGAGQQDGIYAQRALQALEGARAVDVAVVPADRLLSGDGLRGVSAMVIVGTAGLDRRGADALAAFVREGGGLLVTAGPGTNAELLAAGFGRGFPRVRLGPSTDGTLALAVAETRHPALDVFAVDPGAFNDVRFTRVADVLGEDGSDVLARFDSGAPALVATAYGRGRLAVFASDVSNRWNDFALQPAVVPFLGETVRWLAGARTPPDALIAGTSPVEGADKPGVIAWKPAKSAGATTVAVNVDPREFDPARQDGATFVERVPRDGVAPTTAGDALARRQEAAQGLWRYGLGLMLVSLVVESLIGRRA